MVHVRQVEDMMVLSLLVATAVLAWTGDPWLPLIIWASGGLWQVTNFLTATMRHGTKDMAYYRLSEHEKSAYAQTDEWSKGTSWTTHKGYDETGMKKDA